ncbi:hypothetical protein C8Q76DRAFT_209006 [Earliella scabrosa]|nr:hypothetical protein C8Q76DRAFT_209006 [Earliella scabrosa]
MSAIGSRQGESIDVQTGGRRAPPSAVPLSYRTRDCHLARMSPPRVMVLAQASGRTAGVLDISSTSSVDRLRFRARERKEEGDVQQILPYMGLYTRHRDLLHVRDGVLHMLDHLDTHGDPSFPPVSSGDGALALSLPPLCPPSPSPRGWSGRLVGLRAAQTLDIHHRHTVRSLCTATMRMISRCARTKSMANGDRRRWIPRDMRSTSPYEEDGRSTVRIANGVELGRSRG